MSPEIVCPGGHHEHAALVQLMAETSRRAATRPVTPEVLHLCPSCGTMLILSVHPAPQKAMAG
jgi:hypothetical protein